MTESDAPKQSSRRRHWIVAVAIAAAVVCSGGVMLALTHQINRQLADSCGSILTVVNPEGSTFQQLSSDVNSGKGIVRLLYVVNRPGEASERRSVIICAFGGAEDWSHTGPNLVAASVDGKSLGPARIALLNRFWLSKGADG